ncbi:MAG TPA: peroxiredoxin [Pyrinomonadaceae bacterium]|jgi:peroxiredoxin Q/BCP
MTKGEKSVSEAARAVVNVGESAPDFALPDAEGQTWRLSEHKGETVVLLFYPGDNTPVCTKQMCSVRDRWSDYLATGARIVGISTDTVESHKGFAAKYNLPFPLLADPTEEVVRAYGVRSWLPNRSARAVVVINAGGIITYKKVQPLSLFPPRDDRIIAAILEAVASDK